MRDMLFWALIAVASIVLPAGSYLGWAGNWLPQRRRQFLLLSISLEFIALSELFTALNAGGWLHLSLAVAFWLRGLLSLAAGAALVGIFVVSRR